MSEEQAPKQPQGQPEGQAASPQAGAAPGSKTSKPAHVLEQPKGEVGGPEGPEPTRYGDWSFKGIASDF